MPTYTMHHARSDMDHPDFVFDAVDDEQAKLILADFKRSLSERALTRTYRISVHQLEIGRWSFKDKRFLTQIGSLVAEWPPVLPVGQPQEAAI